MPARELDGKAVAETIRDKVGRRVAELQGKTGRVPGLSVVLVGADSASEVYVRKAERQITGSRRSLLLVPLMFIYRMQLPLLPISLMLTIVYPSLVSHGLLLICLSAILLRIARNVYPLKVAWPKLVAEFGVRQSIQLIPKMAFAILSSYVMKDYGFLKGTFERRKIDWDDSIRGDNVELIIENN